MRCFAAERAPGVDLGEIVFPLSSAMVVLKAIMRLDGRSDRDNRRFGMKMSVEAGT